MDYSSIKYMSSLVCNYPGVVSKRYGEVWWVESAGSGSKPGKGGVGVCGAGDCGGERGRE